MNYTSKSYYKKKKAGSHQFLNDFLVSINYSSVFSCSLECCCVTQILISPISTFSISRNHPCYHITCLPLLYESIHTNRRSYMKMPAISQSTLSECVLGSYTIMQKAFITIKGKIPKSKEQKPFLSWVLAVDA